MMPYPTQEESQAKGSNNPAEFTVMIIASGPLRSGGIVHAVAVTQPVQSWTVLRSHDDFYAVSDVLSQLLPDVPACPVILDSGSDVVSVVNARNDLQKWLTAALTHPGCTETLAVRNFLTHCANIILPQFEGVSWTSFDAEGAVVPPDSSEHQQQDQHEDTDASNSGPAASSNSGLGSLDDMEMDDMFLAEDENGGLEHDDTDEDDEYVRPSIRYQPTDEEITEDDEFEMMQFANEVEMIEDLGSLAQSLGASHLGRSLQLQAEIATRDNPQGTRGQEPQNLRGGLNVGGIGSVVGHASAGGIRSAMENADSTSVADAFGNKPLESAPRLDSFKMMKVIGKGSFGNYYRLCRIEFEMCYD
jgi:hypothetical protein